MSTLAALAAFTLAAGLLTITPGLDTVLVLRTWLTEGRASARLAGLGIETGCLIWGTAVAVGLGAVLAAVPLAYDALRWTGACYLLVCGTIMLVKPRTVLAAATEVHALRGRSAFSRGLLTNLLNPKVGLFYLSFLPQFVPAGMTPAPFMIGLTLIHIVLGLVWFGLLLGGATTVRSFVTAQPRIVRWLDRLTGTLFVGFGLRLALDRT